MAVPRFGFAVQEIKKTGLPHLVACKLATATTLDLL